MANTKAKTPRFRRFRRNVMCVWMNVVYVFQVYVREGTCFKYFVRTYLPTYQRWYECVFCYGKWVLVGRVTANERKRERERKFKTSAKSFLNARRKERKRRNLFPPNLVLLLQVKNIFSLSHDFLTLNWTQLSSVQQSLTVLPKWQTPFRRFFHNSWRRNFCCHLAHFIFNYWRWLW